jgi:hypothetical protein
MANATITTLTGAIATVTLDETQSDTYQDEIIRELARLSIPWVLVQTGASFVATVRGQAVYNLPTTDGARTALMICFDDKQLAHARYDEAMFFDDAWRDSQARPVAFLNDTINRAQFAAIALTPLDFTTWPDGNLTVIYAKSDTAFAGSSYSDTYLAMAFEVIARELGRDSDHTDPEAATLAKTLANVFWRLSFPEGS